MRGRRKVPAEFGAAQQLLLAGAGTLSLALAPAQRPAAAPRLNAYALPMQPAARAFPRFGLSGTTKTRKTNTQQSKQ